MRWFIGACAALALACPVQGAAPGPAASAGSEQAFPAKAVRIVVPFAAGGTFDTVARVTAQRLTEIWGQQVIVENRAGGGTLIAADVVAHSNPDGYTMYLSPNGLAAVPTLNPKVGLEMQRSLAPVVLLAAQPMALGANPAFKPGTIKELVALAKAKPGALSYGTAGIASGGHLAGELFRQAAGIELTHVSYKGGNVAMMDVVANQIPLVMTGLPNLLPLMKAGRVKILAVTDSVRSPVAPDIPTIGETVPGYEFRNWFGLLVAAGTPKPLVARLNADVNRAAASTEVKQRLLDQGFVILGGTPDAFAKVIREDTVKFKDTITRAGLAGVANR
jgi:tripartite-type tricarboxylate transporter receptor subunit TctC